jgi:hypothetical protein
MVAGTPPDSTRGFDAQQDCLCRSIFKILITCDNDNNDNNLNNHNDLNNSHITGRRTDIAGSIPDEY